MADREAVPTAPSEPDKPGVMDRLRNRFAWFNRIMVAQDRYNYCKGDFYAAGITYFTIFALFPLLMVGFSIGGFVLANQPDLMAEVEERIRSSVSGDLGSQLVELMDSAIDSRGTVGVIGLLTAAWAGLGWMANLREALSQMWEQRHAPGGFVSTKLSDLLSLVSAFVALALTIGLTALSKESPMTAVLGWFGLQDVPGLGVGLQVASWVFSLGVSWMLFTWIIARLPRESVSFRSSLQAGLIVAVAFEVFKQVASIYLRAVVTGPAGATFGPVLGLMVFAYITARLILFATAWAATAPENLEAVPVEPPGPVRISPRIEVREGVGMSGAVASFAVGAIGALGLSRLLRSRR
ncbi:inner membrane protein YhjD [Mycolicibacterium frederiksbergense]|nr:inner membrane protein YhjD [Mycolicibacterium frederiksbergense]